MGKCKFDDKWQEEDKYRGWLKLSADQHEARCELCKKTFKLGTMGCGALDSHMKSEKHQRYLKIQKTNMAIDPFAAAKRFPNMPGPTDAASVRPTPVKANFHQNRHGSATAVMRLCSVLHPHWKRHGHVPTDGSRRA